MFWSILGRMLWAQRIVILVTVGCALIGGLAVVMTAPPRYDATARVQMNISRPTVAGVKISSKTIDAYIGSQIAMIRDVQVVGRAIEQIGWADNPDVVASYNARPPGDQLDIVTWLALRVAPGVSAYPVEDSDLLEIRYGASSPELAKVVVGAIRDAYVAASINGRRNQAAEQAEVQKARADIMAKDLADLQVKQVEFERRTGVILGSDPVDVDSDRLSSLVTGQRAVTSDVIQPRSVARQALLELDSEIAQATGTLGPNHPHLQDLQRRRATLAAAAAQEGAVGSTAQAAVAATARDQAAVIAAQTQRVLSQRPDLAQAQLIRDEIAGKQRNYNAVMKQVIDLRQQANTSESGLTPVGEVQVPTSPSFPDKALILGGTGGIGLLAGMLIGMIMELLSLRVRTPWSVNAATGLPIVGRVPRMRTAKRRPLLGRGALKPIEGIDPAQSA